MTSPTTNDATPRGDGTPAAKGGRARLASSPFTTRAALLAVVLGALVLSLALPVREYVRQRSEISALQQEQAMRQSQVAALERRLKQWEDPAFVATQARQRLQYVMPGEVGYVVLDPAEAPAPERERTESANGNQQKSWYTRLWGSVGKADAAR